MEIETRDARLVAALKNTAPDGVSVIFDPPKMVRGGTIHNAAPLVLVTLHFAANVDIAAVAIWLFDKLKSKKGTKTTHNRLEIELSREKFRLVIESETHSKDG